MTQRKTFTLEMNRFELGLVQQAIEMAGDTFLDMINDDDRLTQEAKVAQACGVGRLYERIVNISKT